MIVGRCAVAYDWPATVGNRRWQSVPRLNMSNRDTDSRSESCSVRYPYDGLTTHKDATTMFFNYLYMLMHIFLSKSLHLLANMNFRKLRKILQTLQYVTGRQCCQVVLTFYTIFMSILHGSALKFTENFWCKFCLKTGEKLAQTSLKTPHIA